MWNILCSHSGQLGGGKHVAQTGPALKLLTLSSNLGIRTGFFFVVAVAERPYLDCVKLDSVKH